MTTQNDFHLEKLVSKRAKARAPVHFKDLTISQDIVPHPNPISLGGGCPNDGFFPIDSIQINLVKEPFQHLSLSSSATSESPAESHLATPEPSLNGSSEKSTYEDGLDQAFVHRYKKNENEIDLKEGLQYAAVEGLPQLIQFTKDFIKKVHPPKYEEWSTLIDTGAGNGLDKASDLFLNEGDVILIEEFTFTPFLQNIKNHGGTPLPVKLNFKKDGIDVEYLANLLDNWAEIYPDHPKPKVLYTIPTGQNPTGLTQSLETRKQVYAIAEKHDFVIIEDDPYGYITIPPYKSGATAESYNVSIDEYLTKEVTPSYLTIDTTGRVIRIETFSKLFAPGLRLGFVVAHKNFIKYISNYSNLATRAPSGPPQFLVNNVIQHWGGVDGWIKWILKIRKAYILRRDVFLATVYDSEAYKRGLIDPIDPRAGMFVSVLINLPQKYKDDPKNIPIVLRRLTEKTVINGVEVVPGPNMSFSDIALDNSSFYRLTIAAVSSNEELIEALNRFSKSVVEFFDELN